MEVSLSGARFSRQLLDLRHTSFSSSQSHSHKLSPLRFSHCRSCSPQANASKTLDLSSRRYSTPLSVSATASGKDSDDSFTQDLSEDTDEMYDSLFDRYGKVVYSRNDKKSASAEVVVSAEVDHDAESLAFAVAMAKVASDVKAGDIKVLFVKPLVYWTRFFIIATAFSRPQIEAIRFRMRDAAEKQYGRSSNGDTKPNSWTLVDFGDVVVHIFLPEQRAYYNLEEFYANATSVELPSENRPPYRGPQ